MTTTALKTKEAALLKQLKSADSMIVAYSGGVDSSLLAHYAKRVLGPKALVVIAISPSLAHEELEAARYQAKQQGWDLLEIFTDELDKPEYVANDGRRCYFCKSTLFDTLDKLAAERGIQSLAYGANVDDRRDFRPGHQAAQEHHVLSPLQDAGLTKEEIRQLAQQSGLSSWNRPQAACLSSRFPVFQPVTRQALSQVEKAEHYLHQLGFRQVRVRHYGNTAKIEIDLAELPRLSNDIKLLQLVESELNGLGYKQVIVDPEGYRTGSVAKLAPTLVEKHHG